MRGRRYKVRTIPTDLETILSNLLRQEHRDTVSRHATFTRNILAEGGTIIRFSSSREHAQPALSLPTTLPRTRPTAETVLFFPDNGVARGRASQLQEIYRPTFRLLRDTLFPGKEYSTTRHEKTKSRPRSLNWQRNSPMNRSDPTLAPPRH